MITRAEERIQTHNIHKYSIRNTQISARKVKEKYLIIFIKRNIHYFYLLFSMTFLSLKHQLTDNSLTLVTLAMGLHFGFEI